MTGLAPCLCGHPDAAHGHYRTGSECALCGDCARYRRARPPLPRRIAAALGLGRKAGPEPEPEVGDDAIAMVKGWKPAPPARRELRHIPAGDGTFHADGLDDAIRRIMEEGL